MLTSPNLNFAWLNHGFGTRDSPPPPGLTTVRQIHSAQVLDATGRKGGQIGDGDAIISCEPGVSLGVRTADCVPILLADAETRVIACIHAGWRGTAANIATAAIDAMQSRGCRPENIHVAIGPSIGACCYEVGPEVAEQFSAWRSDTGRKLDLPAINERQLRAAGVQDIWKSGACTYCNPERFFSFRREREQAGRMLSFIARAL